MEVDLVMIVEWQIIDLINVLCLEWSFFFVRKSKKLALCNLDVRMLLYDGIGAKQISILHIQVIELL